mgnify:CR=1 FL=1
MAYTLETVSAEDLKHGFTYEAERRAYVCLTCGAVFTEGEIYPLDGRFFDALHAAERHAAQAHGDRFSQLLSSESKYVALTQNQRELLTMLSQGMSDAEIAAATGLALSTVRSQRFTLREKAKQAKLYAALYELAVEKREKRGDALMPIHDTAKFVDDRYIVTEAESQKIIHNAFSCLAPLKLKNFPVKEKRKLVILRLIAGEFEKSKRYTEPEVNAILEAIYADFVTLRRYLIEYGFLDRTNDGKEYWLK